MVKTLSPLGTKNVRPALGLDIQPRVEKAPAAVPAKAPANDDSALDLSVGALEILGSDESESLGLLGGKLDTVTVSAEDAVIIVGKLPFPRARKDSLYEVLGRIKGEEIADEAQLGGPVIRSIRVHLCRAIPALRNKEMLDRLKALKHDLDTYRASPRAPKSVDAPSQPVALKAGAPSPAPVKRSDGEAAFSKGVARFIDEAHMVPTYEVDVMGLSLF